MFVMPQARRQEVGQLLLEAVEDAARQRELATLRLDTGSHLTEAGKLYAKNGYRQVRPFNDFRLAERWGEKPLT